MRMDIESLIVLYVVLLFSVCLHEFAHAWAANRCGDDTAKLMGRMTLNPIAHIDPIGTIIFPLLAMMTGAPLFGWAKPVPVNSARFGNYKRDDIFVSLAGVASNLLLALTAAFMLRAIYISGGFPYAQPVIFMLRYLMYINVILGVFNLVPIPPLDGSHVLYHYLPMEAAQKFQMLRQYGFILLILLLMTGVLGVLIAPPLAVFRIIAGPLG